MFLINNLLTFSIHFCSDFCRQMTSANHQSKISLQKLWPQFNFFADEPWIFCFWLADHLFSKINSSLELQLLVVSHFFSCYSTCIFTLLPEKIAHSGLCFELCWHSGRLHNGKVHRWQLTASSGFNRTRHVGQTGVEFGTGPLISASSAKMTSPLLIALAAVKQRPFSGLVLTWKWELLNVFWLKRQSNVFLLITWNGQHLDFVLWYL